jgi:hypothetical protein
MPGLILLFVMPGLICKVTIRHAGPDPASIIGVVLDPGSGAGMTLKEAEMTY